MSSSNQGVEKTLKRPRTSKAPTSDEPTGNPSSAMGSQAACMAASSAA